MHKRAPTDSQYSRADLKSIVPLHSVDSGASFVEQHIPTLSLLEGVFLKSDLQSRSPQLETEQRDIGIPVGIGVGAPEG